MCRTTGNPTCSSSRRLAHCSVATCSRSSAMARPSPAMTSLTPPSLRRNCSTRPHSAPPCPQLTAGSPTWRRASSPSCTALRTLVTAPAWDVHATAYHVLGMAELAASPMEQARQFRAAKRAEGLLLDALTALQVDKHRHRPPAEIVARLVAVTPRAVKNRGRTPWLIRQVRMSDQPVDSAGAQTEDWT